MKSPYFLLVGWAILALSSCYKEVPNEAPTFEIINDLHIQDTSRNYVDAIETQDHLFVAVGSLRSLGNSNRFIHLEKRNRSGILVWGKKIGNGTNDAFAVSETLYGEILIAGYQGDKGLLYKTDSEGDPFMSFSATVGNTDSQIRDVDVAPNGDIFALALIGPPNASSMVVIKLRTVSGGELTEIDRHTLILNGLVATGDKCSLDASQAGRVSITGTIWQSNTPSTIRGIVIQLDANSGAELFNKPYAGAITYLNDVVTLPNGNAFAVGARINSSGSAEIYLVNACPSSDCGWDESLPGTNSMEAWACALTNEGSVGIAGKRFVDGAQSAAHFFKITTDGNNTISDPQDYGGRSATESEGANSLFLCKDGGWLMTATIEKNPSPGYLLKTDEHGIIH